MSDFGRLSDYITGASVKRLSAVECDISRSNQHELNGIKNMKNFLGEKSEYNALFIRLNDDNEKSEVQEGNVTWYDARENHPTRSEFRFYYQKNQAIEKAQEGDTLAVILKKDRTIIFVSAPQESQSEQDLLGLFGKELSTTFKVFDIERNNSDLSVTRRFLLEQIGFEINATHGRDYLPLIEERFGSLIFPKTYDFSALARETSGHLSDFSDTDDALINWWDTEEAMFRQLEKALIDEKLKDGFSDSDDFLKFSMSVRQRRSSRAGNALENHLACLFDEMRIKYSWEAKTENNKKPDFLFPSIESYRCTDFPAEKLTMLGVKTTCKDRWRQVLSEADRIPEKHLFTLQPKISANQTKEMMDSSLQLIVPTSIQSSYTEDQQKWLWNLETFISHVTEIQSSL